MEFLFIGAFQLILILLVFLFPILALISLFRNNFPGKNDKLLWLLIILLIPYLGSILYFLIGRPKRQG